MHSIRGFINVVRDTLIAPNIAIGFTNVPLGLAFFKRVNCRTNNIGMANEYMRLASTLGISCADSNTQTDKPAVKSECTNNTSVHNEMEGNTNESNNKVHKRENPRLPTEVHMDTAVTSSSFKMYFAKYCLTALTKPAATA